MNITKTALYKQEMIRAKSEGVEIFHSREIDYRGHWSIAREGADYWLNAYRSRDAAVAWARKRGIDYVVSEEAGRG